MKRGKDEEKIMGPMFPRLHVNDTEKGGPRAPPRNKMALYEQLSIPSHRFNPGVLPPPPNNTSNLVTPASSSQGSGNERGTFFPLQQPPSIHPVEKPHTRYTDLNTPLVQLEQKKKLEEDDCRVPIFHSGKSQDHTKNYSSMDKVLSPYSPAYSGRLVTLQSTTETEPKRTDTNGPNSREEPRNLSEKNSREFMAGNGQSIIYTTNQSSREKTEGPLKQNNASSSYGHRDHPVNNISTFQSTDDSLQCEYRAKSQPDNIIRGHGVSSECIRGIDYRKSSIPMRDLQTEEQRSPNDPTNSEDVSETSIVDSISCMDISPDDVVGIIGQKHFWKARRAIVNQQRVFAVQVFELHRLMKVQRSIAGSPHLLLDDTAYLGKPLKGPLAKNLPLEYIVKTAPNVSKQNIVTDKPNHKMECSAENAVGKASPTSIQNGCQPSIYGPFSGNQPPAAATTDPKMGPWSFNQPPGHQWLVPVMTPSEGLVYKPYPGPGFMGPVFGGCGPPGSTPVMGNFFHHYQGLGVAPFAPPVGHNYFPPYGMPVMNPAISGSAGEQMNFFTAQGLHGQFSRGGADYSMQYQSSCSVPSRKNRAVSNAVKLHSSKDSELQVSTASSPSERAQETCVLQTTDGRTELPLLPPAPVVQVRDGAPQPSDTDQPTRVIKVVPHNARSASESAARIFQSIQEERKQYESM